MVFFYPFTNLSPSGTPTPMGREMTITLCIYLLSTYRSTPLSLIEPFMQSVAWKYLGILALQTLAPFAEVWFYYYSNIHSYSLMFLKMQSSSLYYYFSQKNPRDTEDEALNMVKNQLFINRKTSKPLLYQGGIGLNTAVRKQVGAFTWTSKTNIASLLCLLC